MAGANASKAVDLVKLFGTVAKTMSQNQSTLNEADTYNHDHGDNMVQIFEVITQAMKEKKTASAADQLEYASKILRSKSGSGSAQIYAEGLKDAANQFSGQKTISADNALELVQTLLGSATGATTPPTTQGAESTGIDLLGSLFGGLTGTDSTQPGASQQDSGIDVGDLLNAGAAFMQAKQSGGSNMDAILSALVSSSKVGTQDYRAQSGALVANTLMQVVSQMTKAKK